MPASMTPGQIIREARLAHGLSLGQLASAVGRTASSVRRWENDDAMPSAAVLDELAAILEIDRSALERSPDADETSATGGEATVDVPAVEGDDTIAAPSGEILGDAAVGEEGDPSDAVVEIELLSTRDAVAPSETATPAGVPMARAVPVAARPAVAAAESAPAGAALESATTEEAAVPVDEAGAGPAPAPGVDPAAATVPVAVPPGTIPVRPPATRSRDAEAELAKTDTEGLVFPVPPPTEPAARPAEPPAESWWQHPLRRLREGDQRWRYYLRGALTVIALVLLAWGLVWAFGELFEALGDLWDTFGRSSDTVDAGPTIGRIVR